MQEYMVERVLEGANHIIENGATIRETAEALGVSKTTVHIDITHRLRKIDPKLRNDVEKVIERNIEERATRGGMATRLKYEKRSAIC